MIFNCTRIRSFSSAYASYPPSPPCKLRHVLHIRRVVYRGESVSTYGATPPPSLAVVRPWCRLTSLGPPPLPCPRSLYGNDLTDKSVPALAAALAHLPNLKYLECDPHTLPPWSHSHCSRALLVRSAVAVPCSLWRRCPRCAPWYTHTPLPVRLAICALCAVQEGVAVVYILYRYTGG